MTVMQSCDHHDQNRCIPDNRSRERILEQFDAALRLGDAVGALAAGGMSIDLFKDNVPLPEPLVTFQLERFTALWEAFRVWRSIQPKGDDLAPAVKPPAEIRVPPLGD